MAAITGKYSSATAYSVTLSGMTIGTVYAILIQDLNSDGSSNGYDCVWKSGATSSTTTLNRTTTSTFSQYSRKIGYFQGTFSTSVGTHITDAQFSSWADGTGTISAWGGGGSTGYILQVASDGWPSILSSVKVTSGTFTSSNNAINYSTRQYITQVVLTGAAINNLWTGNIYWKNASGSKFLVATVTNGGVSLASSIEPIDCTGNRTISFIAEGQIPYKYRIHAMTTANGSYFSGGSQDYYMPSSSSWYTSTTVSNTFNLNNLPIPIREYYKLAGWSYTNTSSSIAYTGTVDVSATAAGKVNNFYAVWTLAPTIVLNANGGKFQDTRSTTREYTKQTPGDIFYFASASGLVAKDGYKLLGWSASSTATIAGYGPNGQITIGDSTIQRYYAVWQKAEVTITLQGNGGLWGGNLQYRTIKKEVGDTLQFADYGPDGTPPLQRAYYTLVGWSTSSTGTAAWGVNEAITVGTTDATYYAVWKHYIKPFYWDGNNGVTDLTIIAKGLPISNLTADRWNSLKAKIKEIATAQGNTAAISAISGNVTSGDTLTADEYNGVRLSIGLVTNHGTLPAIVTTGGPVLASYFNGTTSLKSAINTAIIAWNNS